MNMENVISECVDSVQRQSRYIQFPVSSHLGIRLLQRHEVHSSAGIETGLLNLFAQSYMRPSFALI